MKQQKEYSKNFDQYNFRSYEIHQKKLIQIRDDLEKRKLLKVNGDTSYDHLKSQMTNNKLKSHEFNETEKINEIKRSNQILLDKLLDISKGKRCDVKQENISTTLPPGKSLNYQVKRREAERIDHENQKIMERIVNQNASLSSKKMHQDYVQQLKYKKMKEQKMGLSIDKILEKKRRMVLEARSTILPLLNTKQNSPGNEQLGRNFNFGGTIDSQSQRIINTTQVDNATNNYSNQRTINQQNQTAAVMNNRYKTNSQLTQMQNQSMSPSSQRQQRMLAKSELQEYKDDKKSLVQSQIQKKPYKVVLESLNQKQAINAKINSSLQLKQNKPPVPPQININSKSINKNEYNIKSQISSNLLDMPPVKTSSLSKSFTNNNKQANLTNKPIQQPPLANFYSNNPNPNESTIKKKDSGIKLQNNNHSQEILSDQSSNSQLQEVTPKVNVAQSINQYKQTQNLEVGKSILIEKDQLQNKKKDDEFVDNNDNIGQEIDDDIDNQFATNQNDLSVIKKQQTQKQVDKSLNDDSKQYLEKNSILSDTINNSNVKDKSNAQVQQQIDDNDDQYEEEFEEELVD